MYLLSRLRSQNSLETGTARNGKNPIFHQDLPHVAQGGCVGHTGGSLWQPRLWEAEQCHQGWQSNAPDCGCNGRATSRRSLTHCSHWLLPSQCNSQRSRNQRVLSIKLIKLINPPANHRLTSIPTNTNKWIKCFSRGGKLTTLILGPQQFLSTNSWYIISRKKRCAIRFLFSMHVSGNTINHVCKMLQGSSN